MAYLGSWKIDDLLTFPANTHTASTGAATDADAVPDYRVYEDETGTAILTGSMAKLDDANTTGFYSEQLTLSVANGLEKGKCYTIYVSATVGGVTGTMAHTFQIEAEVDANTVSPTVSANAIQISGDATAADNAEAFFDGTGYAGTGNTIPTVTTVTNTVNANTIQLSGDTTAADNAEAFFDGTGYAGTGNTIPTVTTVTTVSGLAANSVTASALATDAVAEIADGVWDEATSGHTTSGTFGQQSAIIRANTAQAGASTTITLDASASAVDDFYNNTIIFVTGGTGVGQSRIISDYVGSTKVATVSAWATNPSSDSVFVVLPFGAIPGATAPTADEVANAVWDEPTSGHTTAGTFGEQLKTDVDAILADTGTDGVVLGSGAITASVIASNAIDADALAVDVQTELRSLVSGTSDSGTTTTMVDAARTEADTDYWKGAWILFTSGNISGQARLITGFTPGTDTITFTPATTQAVATQTYEILPAGSIDIGSISGDATAADNAEAFFDGTGYAGTNNVMPTTTTVTNTVNANTVQLSGDTTAADNAEAFFDGTGYAGTGNVIPTVTAVTTVNGLAANTVTASALATDAVSEIRDGVLDGAMAAELASLPSQTTPTLRQMIQLMYQRYRNRYTITATTAVNYKADGTTALQSATVSDDGTTVVRGAGS